MWKQERDLEGIIDGFGRPYRFLGGSMVIKAYPCCTASHTAIYSMLALKDEYRFRGSDIAKITCYIDPIVPKILIYDRPTNGNEAKFCMPYSLAVAAQHGKAGIAEFTLETGVPDADTLAVMDKVAVLTDDSFPKGPSGATVASRLQIELKDGRRLDRFQGAAPGSAGQPLSDQDLEKKFVECLAGRGRDHTAATFGHLLGSRSLSSFSEAIDIFSARRS